MEQDEIIRQSVHSALSEADISDVHIDVRGGVAVVSGVVDVLNDRETVENVIKEVPGVVDVENNLTISTEGTIERKDIEEAVNEKLRDRGYDEISVSYNKGTVFLQGEVENLNMKKEVGNIAGEVLGIKNIVNKVRVKEPERNDDATITNAVEAAIAADERLDSRDIKTTVRNGKVIMEGYVENSSQRLWAEQVVASVPGVKKVICRLDEGS